MFKKFICFLFLNTSFVLSSQENTIFKFNLLGSTIDEIIALEGPFDGWLWEILDLGYYFSRLRDESFDRELYWNENSYIQRAFYDVNRKVFDYPSRIGYYFTENSVCSSCRYIMYLPDSSDINDHLFNFNNILNYLMELYGDQRIQIIKISEKWYLLELDNKELSMKLYTFDEGRAQVDLWYSND